MPVFETKVRVAGGGPRRVNGGVKPLAVVNVKPYTLIFRGRKLLCFPGEFGELPLVFDTRSLAQLYIEVHCIEDGQLKCMQLEELAHMCRDRKVVFDKFYILDDESQIFS